MRRIILAAAVVVGATLAFAAPAQAIPYGTPDGKGHPEVGALLAPQPYSDGTWETCSGTLISPTVFLTPARLPRAGSLSSLSLGTRFTAVGYGAQSVTIEQGPTFHYADIRYVATGGLETLNPSWLRLSMNPALGDGGTCYGDSGGPNFLGAGATETNIVAATTITGDFMCRATNVVYRLDTAPARAFLGQFVTLP